MILHVSKSPSSNEVEHISFPADAGKVRYAMIGLEEFGGWAPAYIIGGEGPAQALTGCIPRDELFSETGVQKLNQLAELVDTMDLAAQKVFAGALALEHANGVDDVLRVAGSLDSYELLLNIKTDEELGHFLVDTGQITGKYVFAEAVRPYLDYAKIGAEQRRQLGGIYTTQGFLKHREAVQTQEAVKRPTFALTLVSPINTYRLNLPAVDNELEQAKRALRLDDLGSAVIKDVGIDYPWAHLLPMGSITLKDANTLAECVQVMTEQEQRVFGAVLEVEGPPNFSDAVCIAEEIDLYELVTDSEREYGLEALRYAGAGDEILEMLDGFTDFDALGRSEMEADGVRETSFGSVRRLSGPWPEQLEQQGQTMC